MHAVITVFPLFRFSVSQLTNNLCQPRCGKWSLVPYLQHLFISFCFTLIFRLAEFRLKFEQKLSYKIPHLQFLPSYIPHLFSILFLCSSNGPFLPLPAFLHLCFLPFFFLLISKKLHAIFLPFLHPILAFSSILPLFVSHPFVCPSCCNSSPLLPNSLLL